MNARESRIGNILTYNGFIVEVVEVKKLHLRVRFLNKENQNEMMSEHDNFNGIELNEEWLLRFGFEIKEKNYSLNVGGELFRYAIKDSFIIWKTHRNLWQFYEFTNNYTQYEYVHQLQNLYFALTGEELTIKE